MAITKTTVTSFLLATLLASTLALPAEELNGQGLTLGKRGPKKGKDKSNPKRVEWDQTNWPETSEEDCAVLLCSSQYAGDKVFQKQPNQRASKDAYTKESRANKQPFQNGGQWGGRPIAPDTTSPEDIPPRSLQVNGRTRYVAPTRRSQNSRQGTAIKEGYRKAEDGGLGAGEWGEIHFKGNLGPCCRAYESRDFTACTDGRCVGKPRKDDFFGEKDIDLNDFIFHTTRSGQSYNFESGLKKRDVNGTEDEEPIYVRGIVDPETSGEDLVKTLTEIRRKRDEEDAQQARKRREEYDSSDIEKRDADDDYIAAGFELDLEDLE